MNPETRVGEVRFHAEVDRIGEFLAKKQGWQERGERMPLAFFDELCSFRFRCRKPLCRRSFEGDGQFVVIRAKRVFRCRLC